MTTAHLPRLLLTAALLFACEGDKQGDALPPASDVPPPAIPPPPAKDPNADLGTVAAVSSRYVATALPKHSVELGPKLSGTLAAVMVEEGERVKKGQALFRLNAESIQLGVAQAQTALEGAKIARDNAEKELERQRQLAAKGTVSAAVLERAEAAYSAATNSVSAASVGVSVARRGSVDSTVYSPIDGVVARKLKSAGETATMMPPTVVVIINDQSTIELRARIPESSLKQIREGEKITAHFSSVDVVREAKIVRIQPTVDPMTRTIEIVADVENSDDLLRPGMYVEVDLTPPPADAKPPAGKADDAAPADDAEPAEGKAAKKKKKKSASKEKAP